MLLFFPESFREQKSRFIEDLNLDSAYSEILMTTSGMMKCELFELRQHIIYQVSLLHLALQKLDILIFLKVKEKVLQKIFL